MSTRDLNDAEPILASRFNRARNDFLSPKKWRGRTFDIKVSAVLRPDEEQKALYWSSRREVDGKVVDIPGARHVTFLDGVQDKSRHQANKNGKSEAIDFFLVRKKTGKADWTAKIMYFIFGRFAEKYGLEWGGRWAFRDMAHVQLQKNWQTRD